MDYAKKFRPKSISEYARINGKPLDELKDKAVNSSPIKLNSELGAVLAGKPITCALIIMNSCRESD